MVYKYHIFFIHSSIEGHLCCPQFLAIVNNAAMKWECRYFCETLISLLLSSLLQSISKEDIVFDFGKEFTTLHSLLFIWTMAEKTNLFTLS